MPVSLKPPPGHPLRTRAAAPRPFMSDTQRGVGTIAEHSLAAVTLQRAARGHLTRLGLWRFGGAGTHHMATKAQRRWRGLAGRARARRFAQARDAAAARVLISLFLGYQGRAIARARRIERANAAATRLQTIYRGRLTRRWYRKFRKAYYNARALTLERVWRGARGRKRARATRDGMRAAEAKIRALAALHRAGRLIETVIDEHTLLVAAHVLLCEAEDYDAAYDLLCEGRALYPRSVPVAYAFAIAAQLAWPARGKFGVPSPRILDDALVAARAAWAADPSRVAYKSWEFGHFRAALRMHPHSAAAMGAAAVCCHTVGGDFEDARDRGGKPPTVREVRERELALEEAGTAEAYRRARALFGRSLRFAGRVALERLAPCATTFEALYAAPRALLLGRARQLPGGGLGGKAAAPSWMVKVVGAGGALVISALERAKGRQRTLHEYVVHEYELPELYPRAHAFALREGRPAEVVKREDHCLTIAAYLYAQAVIVSRSAFEAANARNDPNAPAAAMIARDPRSDVATVAQTTYAGPGSPGGGGGLAVSSPARDGVAGEDGEGGEVWAATPWWRDPARPRWPAVADADADEDGDGLADGGSGELAFDGDERAKQARRGARDDGGLRYAAAPPGAERRSLQLALPGLQRRREAEFARIVREACARTLQRSFRGYEGRARWRRLKLRTRVRGAAARKLQRRRDRMAAKRLKQFNMAARLQAVGRGTNWRTRLAMMKVNIVECQRLYRGHRARSKIREELRRKLDGPRVYEMYRKGTVVSGCNLMLTVRRCGLSFKFIADDLETCERYVGFVYQSQTMSILRKCQPSDEELMRQDEALRRRDAKAWMHEALGGQDKRINAVRAPRTAGQKLRGAQKAVLLGVKLGAAAAEVGAARAKEAAQMAEYGDGDDGTAGGTDDAAGGDGGRKREASRPMRLLMIKDTRIKPWQHERIVELLLSMLALTAPIHAPTTELLKLDVRRTLVIDNGLRHEVRGLGIAAKVGCGDSRTGKGRVLVDCEDQLTRYYRALKRKENLRRAMGQID